MKTSIAQIAALTSFANAFLQGQIVSFNLGHSTAANCTEISFVEVPSEDLIAGDPEKWFEYLKKEGIDHLILDFVPQYENIKACRESIGFMGGGGRWLIAAEKGNKKGNKVDVWEGRWKYAENQETGNDWLVNYGLIAKDWDLPDRRDPTLNECYANLEKYLEAILEFAQEQNLPDFAEKFKEASFRLASNNPEETLHYKDVLVKRNYSLKARQVLSACQKAFVFGAMGSWNDMSYEGEIQEKYDSISDNLFSTIVMAVCSVVNSYP